MKRPSRIELDHEHAHADGDGSPTPSAFKVVHLEDGTETAGVASLGELLRCLRGESVPAQVRAPERARADVRAVPSSSGPSAPMVPPVERSMEPPVEAVGQPPVERVREPPVERVREPPVEPVYEPPPVELDDPSHRPFAAQSMFELLGEPPLAPPARGGPGSSHPFAWWLAAALTILALTGTFLALFTHELDAFLPGGPRIEVRISTVPGTTPPDVLAPREAPVTSTARASHGAAPAAPAGPVETGDAPAAPASPRPASPTAATTTPAPAPRAATAAQATGARARGSAPAPRAEVPAPSKATPRTTSPAAPSPAPVSSTVGPAPRTMQRAEVSPTAPAAPSPPAEQPHPQPDPRARATPATPAGAQASGDWTQARWGMALDDVLGLLPAQHVRVARGEERRIDGLTPAAELMDVRIASHLYTVAYLFDARGTLAAMEARSEGANDRAHDAFDEVLDWLARKYGPPLSKASAVAPSGDLLRTAHWRARDTSIELQGRAAPSADAHARSADLASGAVRPFRDSQVFLSYRPAAAGVSRSPGNR